jgi:hypothetical protein
MADEFDRDGIGSEGDLTDPFNPNDISIDKKTVLVETCIKRLIQKTIILNPDYQRHEVWDDIRKSRLIESLMLKIPIPMFYVSADEKSVYTVVDGLQRLSSLRDFIIGKDFLERNDEALRGKGMKLQGLEFWTQYDGNTFCELPTYLQNRITETELTFTIINPGTPEEVKRNIFKRINTGGLYLTPQEIRNALYNGHVTELLNVLAASDSFLNATAHSVKTERMDDFELILRCLAFILRGKEFYPKNNSMDTFLSDTMQIINAYPDFSTSDIMKLIKRGNVTVESIRNFNLEDLKNLFIKGMQRSLKLFGDHCFRRSYGDMRRAPINKALFEMWGSMLAMINENEYTNVYSNQKALKTEYYLLLNDISFQNLISRDSWKYASVQKRFEKIDFLISKYKK